MEELEDFFPLLQEYLQDFIAGSNTDRCRMSSSEYSVIKPVVPTDQDESSNLLGANEFTIFFEQFEVLWIVDEVLFVVSSFLRLWPRVSF